MNWGSSLAGLKRCPVTAEIEGSNLFYPAIFQSVSLKLEKKLNQ